MTTNNSVNANSTTPLPIVDGGTAVNAVTTSPTATAFAGWDANKNLSANNHIEAYTTTATAAGTTVLTVGSTFQQFFTGSTTQTVTMPVTSTLVAGQSFLIANNSTGVVTVQSSGANTITAMAGGTQAVFTCINTGVTTAAGWNSDYSSKSFTAPTVQKFTSGTGTYTTPTSPPPLYIRVEAVGGGAGGNGSGTSGSTVGGAGGNTTFGSSLIVANGGNAGSSSTPATASLGTAIGIALSGGLAGIGTNLINATGGVGANSVYGGAGPGGSSGVNGTAANTNSGSGGGGAGGSGATGSSSGGMSGAYVDGIITAPLATYSYAVGGAGTAGGAGASGAAGGLGSAGLITVWEYYQ